MNKKLWKLAVIVAIATTALAFVAWPAEEDSPDNAQRRTATVVKSAIDETVLAIGAIRPVTGAEVNVGSRISGTVVKLPVQVGERVSVGQVLAELDATALNAELDKANADVALSMPRVQLASSVLARRQTMASKGLASAEDVEIADANLSVELAQLDANRAQLRSAEIALAYTRITAPIDGVVAEVTTREGETVAAAFAAPNFVTIIDLDRLEVLAYVDETDIGRVSIGQQASFTVDTFDDIDFAATVTAIQPRAEIQNGVVNYLVRLAFVKPDDYVLRPEMTAHVRIVVSERENAMTAPRTAIKRREGRQFVVVQRHAEWVEQEVRTGWRSERSVEVLSGVREGDVLELNAK